MSDHRAPEPPEGFSVFAVDAAWPESRQVTGHGRNQNTGDAHVYLWFGSPHFDPQVEHVTVLTASSGNAEAGEALEQAFEMYCHPGEEPPAHRPVSEPVVITTDGTPRTFELWRDSNKRYRVARGCVENAEVVLSGSGIEPGELKLIRVHDLTAFTNPFSVLAKAQRDAPPRN